MNDTMIVAFYSLVDDLMKAAGHESHGLAGVKDAEGVTVAVVAAAYFHNHHENALWVMQRMGYLSGKLSTSRFSRRLHKVAHWLGWGVEVAGEIMAKHTSLFVIDTLPLPVCRRIRASRCRKVRGKPYYGICVAKDQRFFGWRLHIIYSLEGVPVSYDLVPARMHDLTAIHELTAHLPAGARVLGDKAFICHEEQRSILAATGVRLVPKYKKNMPAQSWADDYDLRHFRIRAETFNSQLVNMGIQNLHARTQAGFELKVTASLLALTFINLYWQSG